MVIYCGWNNRTFDNPEYYEVIKWHEKSYSGGGLAEPTTVTGAPP